MIPQLHVFDFWFTKILLKYYPFLSTYLVSNSYTNYLPTDPIMSLDSLSCQEEKNPLQQHYIYVHVIFFWIYDVGIKYP